MDIHELIKRTDHIPSSVWPPEQEMWLRRLKDMAPGTVIVDFGTGHGKSAASLALACPQATVYTFDPGSPYINAGCDEEQYEAETRKYIADAGVTNVVFTRESSLEKEWDAPIDVLNIDSDHTYETTKAECEIWIPKVRKGGLIFMHDWEHERCPGVVQAIKEYIGAHNQSLTQLEVTSWSGGVKCACFEKLV